MWFGGSKQSCSVSTLKSLIRNMISGVISGYRYKMRLVHAHFPICASKQPTLKLHSIECIWQTRNIPWSRKIKALIMEIP